MRIRRPRASLLLLAPLAALLISCSAAGEESSPEVDQKRPPVAAEAGGTEGTGPSDSGTAPSGSGEPPVTPQAVQVRDAFAGLQATLNDTCTPGSGDCAYFLGRVHDELDRLDRAMKADPKGPGHFPEPIAWISELRTALGDDRSTANLEKHRDKLIGTRDRINTWMQDHPDDYR